MLSTFYSSRFLIAEGLTEGRDEKRYFFFCFPSPHLHWWDRIFTHARAFGDSCTHILAHLSHKDTSQWWLFFFLCLCRIENCQNQSELSKELTELASYLLWFESSVWRMDGLDLRMQVHICLYRPVVGEVYNCLGDLSTEMLKQSVRQSTENK